MQPFILFYISSHGYGHARRMVQVILALQATSPRLRIAIRSAAPARIFEPLPPSWVETSDIDAGLVENDPLTIDRESSLQRLQNFMARRADIVAAEVAVLRGNRPALIVADIPFLAGNVAAEVGVPCVGISNFTWDWIYENLFGADARYTDIAGSIAEGYAKMEAILQLPFGRVCPSFRQKIPMPLIAMQSSREPQAVLAQLGIGRDDTRPRVLFGTRGGLLPDTLARAAASAPEFLFLCPHEPTGTLPSNALSVMLGPTLDFSDVLRISDVVMSKLGYGMISECIATQTRLVWPAREGFAEDAIVAQEAPGVLPMMPIPVADFYAGNWGQFLRQAKNLPPATQAMPVNGAEQCAEFLSQLCT